MENQKFKKNLQQSKKFRTKKLVEMNYHAREKFNTNSQIKFKTAILKPVVVCSYSVGYIFVQGTKKYQQLAITQAEADGTGR